MFSYSGGKWGYWVTMAFVKHILARITSKNIEHTAFKQWERKKPRGGWGSDLALPLMEQFPLPGQQLQGGARSLPPGQVRGCGAFIYRTGQGVRSLPPGQVRGWEAFLQDRSGGEESSSRTGQGVQSPPPGQVRGCGAFLQDRSGGAEPSSRTVLGHSVCRTKE